MAKVLNPDRVIQDFQSRLTDAQDRYEEVYRAVGESGSEKNLSLRKGLTTDLAFRIGTEWELFQHRWHIAAISKQPARFIKLQQDALDAAMKKNPEIQHIINAVSPGVAAVPSRLNVEQIDSLIDPDGYNVTFSDPNAWAEKAAKHLSQDYARKVHDVVGDPEAHCVLILAKSVRNVIAHGSALSREEFNRAVRAAEDDRSPGLKGARNEPLSRGGERDVSNPAVYLHAWISDHGMRRVGYLAARLHTIADQLRVEAVDDDA
ncbi:hypothetical protein KK092_11425 [Curtobacterium flaccumfaciens pv. flaccumfaciens]|uniref:hypothetical protein n=1 Tax=Curtobacterium TaxID=2034 RepID=UPI001BDE48AA|nr:MULTISPECIES: hypothetical protein [Curtobacterium]MBT1669994.1 hypothetical protein [Curtobacterium flaccumfaciens pv. flaccumfaciens]MCS6588111.1 hypothetical protein [Curtobacterium flaccumfaciens pv. flaccumfaciens]MDT0234999.1 hypothetical protein [Curtobacterium sp. BRB10]